MSLVVGSVERRSSPTEGRWRCVKGGDINFARVWLRTTCSGGSSFSHTLSLCLCFCFLANKEERKSDVTLTRNCVYYSVPHLDRIILVVRGDWLQRPCIIRELANG